MTHTATGWLPVSRRQYLSGLGGGALACALPLLATAADSALPVPSSLAFAAKIAVARGEPLVLLASLPGCPYCELVRRSYLIPMRAQGLAAWQINTTDKNRPVLDFADVKSSGVLLAGRWNIRVTPTVLFFNATGTEIAPRLEGIAVPDFYGAYLDDALAVARQRVKVTVSN